MPVRTLLSIIATQVLMLWVLSSALMRGKSLAVFLVGMAVFTIALAASVRGRRWPLFLVMALTAGSTVTVLGCELVLRLAPGVLSGHLADISRSGYHAQRTGIYRLDGQMGMSMKPGFSRQMTWAGHSWLHRANEDGYRGPRLDHAEVIMLGDSMIYGHGVENAETVPSRLAELTGRSVANLGRQGNSFVQNAITLRRLGLGLRPEVVFVAAHFNDVDDITYWYSEAELERFVGSPSSPPRMPTARSKFHPSVLTNPMGMWASHVALPMRCSPVLTTLYHSLRAGSRPWTVEQSSSAAFVPSTAFVGSPWPPVSDQATASARLGWTAHRRALEDISSAARSVAARVVLFDLGYPTAFSLAHEALAEDLGVDYNPAGRVVLEMAREGAPVYLSNDGHWSPEGSLMVARELARSLP